MSLNLRISIALCAIALSSCSVDFSYPTVVLSESFESKAERIEVKEPTGQYKSTFFDIKLGEYKVDDSYFGKRLKTRLSDQPVSRIAKDNTAWNLLLRGTVDFEKVLYDQYPTEIVRKFSFSVQKPGLSTVKSSCTRLNSEIENKEVSRTSIRFTEVDENEGYSVSYGEWLATQLSCTVHQADNSWMVSLSDSVNSKPSIQIQGSGEPYNVRILRAATSDERGRGGRIENRPDHLELYGTSIPGLAVYQNGQQLAAVSLIGGNSWIWIAPNVAQADEALLISSLHALIVNTWLNYPHLNPKNSS